MQDQEKYRDYSVRDFICDASFQDAVMRPDSPQAKIWAEWQEANPDRQAIVDEARLLLKGLDFREHVPAEGKPEAALEKALQQIDVWERNVRSRRITRLWRVAANWIILLGAGLFVWLWYNFHSERVTVSTTFGQLDSVKLPDQSIVVLNASSTIRFQDRWEKDVVREVWLNGEALFDVKHLDENGQIEPGERFLVHAGNTTIEVLGTRFNIRQRRGKVEIALLSGSVQVHYGNGSRTSVTMQPGELIVVDSAQAAITRSHTNTTDYSAWTQKRLVLTNPSLQEIAHYLEDVYGKKIVLQGASLVNRKVEGPILLDSLDDALFIISTVLDVTIVKEENSIIIKPRQ